MTPRDEDLRPRIPGLQAEHPCWGYRRIWAYLPFVERLSVNKKRVFRVLKEHNLWVKPTPKLKATRMPTRGTPQPTRPNEWRGIDMTKVLGAGFGWVSIVLVLDGDTKKIVGPYAGLPCIAWQWWGALDMAVNQQFPDGVRGHEVCLMRDHGCQPTTVAFMQACQTRGIQQVFPSDHNPTGNADTEGLMRTLNEACLWLQEWTSPFALIGALEVWMAEDNQPSLHSP